jgi:PRC-barrel domain
MVKVHEIERIEDWRGVEVVSSDDERLGKLDDLLYDTVSGDVILVVVKSGRINVRKLVVPLFGAVFGRDRIRLGYPAEQISGAPPLDDDMAIRRRDEVAIADHYGLSAPETSVSEDAVRYESAAVIEQRRAANEEVLRRAAELEALAERKQQESQVEANRAVSAKQNAASADAERQGLLEEASRLRASVTPEEPSRP